jgi:murein DD-endopeptidase MepM/ murein hydrolase activator NlpD
MRHYRLLVGLLVALLIGCSPAETGMEAEEQAAVAPPTLAATAVLPTPTALPPTATRMPTLPPPPTATPQPTATATLTPAPTATPEATATAVPPTPPPGRACPVEYPVKPAYQRFYLSSQPWPTPDPALTAPHFWLAKPLPGGGRFIFNDSYPYGSDGNGRYLLHNGADSAETLGTPVLAAADGVVSYAGPDANALFGWRCDWYGHLVVIEHDQTWLGQPIYTLYGHVLDIVVETGQRVVQGQQVAAIGFGGAAIVPHLHFEVRVGENEFGATRNPMLWISPGATRGVLAGRVVDENGRPWQGVTLTLIDGRGDAPQFSNTWSYLGDPDNLINPDEGYAENFVFADMLPGSYVLFTKIQDVEYRQTVQINAGSLTLAEIVTP